MASGCPGKNFCNGPSQNGTCSECWPWTGQEVVCGWRAARSIAGCLGTSNAGPVGQTRIATKVACLSHGAML